MPHEGTKGTVGVRTRGALPAASGAACGLAMGALALAPAFLARTVPSRLDLADFFWPMKAYTAARWRSGSVPLWNPLSACGEPWLAQLQSGVLYPPDFVFLLAWPWNAWVAILLHLVIGAAGMAAWLRDLGSSRGAAVVGAGLFVSCGAFLSLVPVLNNAWTAAWLPWIFLAARRAATGGSGAGLALASALAFLAGEPVLAAAGTLAAVVLALATRGDEPSRTRGAWKTTATGILLAAGIACAAAWPFAELVARSGRVSTVTRGDAMARPIGVGEIGDLVAPPREEATRVAMPGRGGYLVTLAATPIIFLLAAGAGLGFPGRRRLLVGLAVVAVLGLLVSMGERGGLVPLLWSAGLVRGVRFPARAFVFTHLALCAAAAAGWDGWLYGRFAPDEPQARKERRFARGVALIVFAALLAAAACALATGSSRDLVGTALAGGATCAGGLLLALARRRNAPALLLAGAGIAALAPLPFLGRAALLGTDASALAARPAIASGVRGGRIFSAGSDPSLLAAFSMPTGAWDPLVPLRSRSLLSGYTNLAEGLFSATSGSPIRDRRLTRVLGVALAGGKPEAVLALADVRHLVTPFPTRIPGARLARESAGVRLYELTPGAGRFFFPRAARAAPDEAVFEELRARSFSYDETAWVAESPTTLPPGRARRGWAVGSVAVDEPERTEIATSCSDPGLLVVTRTYDSGWKAEVDGVSAPVLRADLAFLAVTVPAGEHRVLLTYAPASWRIGRFVSLASLLLAAVVWFAAPRRDAA